MSYVGQELSKQVEHQNLQKKIRKERCVVSAPTYTVRFTGCGSWESVRLRSPLVIPRQRIQGNWSLEIRGGK